MKKLIFTVLLGCFTAAAGAQTPSALDFYKQQLTAFPGQNTSANRAYAAALADGLNTWAIQHADHAQLHEALLLKARLELRAQQPGAALVTLMRLRYLFPHVQDELLTPLFEQAVADLPKNYRPVATRAFTAARESTTPAKNEADALFVFSKLAGKSFYAPATQAFEQFFQHYSTYTGNNEVALWYGDLHRLNGNYLAAIAQYQKAGALYPNSPYKAASLRLVGDIYADNLKDTAAATQAYTQVLRDYPGSSETGIVYKHMAILDENNKQYDSALINYDKAIELLGAKTAAYDAYRGKADVFVKLKDYQSAYNQLHHTAATFQANKTYYTECLLKAATLAKKDLRDNTRYTQTLEKLLASGPGADKTPQLMYDLAAAYEQMGQTQKAKTVYQKLILAYPTDKRAASAQSRLNRLTK